MRHSTEPILAIIAGVASWQAWNEIFTTLTIALLTGAFGFLGKYMMQRLVNWLNNRKNKPVR